MSLHWDKKKVHAWLDENAEIIVGLVIIMLIDVFLFYKFRQTHIKAWGYASMAPWFILIWLCMFWGLRRTIDFLTRRDMEQLGGCLTYVIFLIFSLALVIFFIFSDRFWAY